MTIMKKAQSCLFIFIYFTSLRTNFKLLVSLMRYDLDYKYTQHVFIPLLHYENEMI